VNSGTKRDRVALHVEINGTQGPMPHGDWTPVRPVATQGELQGE